LDSLCFDPDVLSPFLQSIVVSFWDTNENHRAIYITVMLIGIILVNLAGVKYFGEFEFGASKLLLLWYTTFIARFSLRVHQNCHRHRLDHHVSCC
jgi:amino acid permease